MSGEYKMFVVYDMVNTFVWVVFTFLMVIFVAFTDLEPVWILYPLIMWFTSNLLFFIIKRKLRYDELNDNNV